MLGQAVEVRLYSHRAFQAVVAVRVWSETLSDVPQREVIIKLNLFKIDIHLLNRFNEQLSCGGADQWRTDRLSPYIF